MITTAHKFLGLSILAFTLSLAPAAFAQNTTPGNPMPPPEAAPPMAAGMNDNAGWNNENFNRKELREEMQQLRKQHEDLEMAASQFHAQCGGGPGGAPSVETPACQQQREALRAQHQALHAQRMALREKMASIPGAHPGQPGGPGPNGAMPNKGPSFAPATN